MNLISEELYKPWTDDILISAIYYGRFVKIPTEAGKTTGGPGQEILINYLLSRIYLCFSVQNLATI